MRPFSQPDIHTVLSNHMNKLKQDIASLETDHVLKASVAELEKYYIQKGMITPG